jgi:hypothetical protein
MSVNLPPSISQSRYVAFDQGPGCCSHGRRGRSSGRSCRQVITSNLVHSSKPGNLVPRPGVPNRDSLDRIAASLATIRAAYSCKTLSARCNRMSAMAQRIFNFRPPMVAPPFHPEGLLPTGDCPNHALRTEWFPQKYPGQRGRACGVLILWKISEARQPRPDISPPQQRQTGANGPLAGNAGSNIVIAASRRLVGHPRLDSIVRLTRASPFQVFLIT